MLYVYELIDPRDGAVFYVGKGTGGRMHDHEADVRAGRGQNPAKCERISAILAAGLRVQCAVVSRHDTDEEAFAAERAHMAKFSALTNMRPGGAGGRTFSATAGEQAEPASSLLARIRPYAEWASMAPRSEADNALYQFVAHNLAVLADLMRPTRPVGA